MLRTITSFVRQATWACQYNNIISKSANGFPSVTRNFSLISASKFVPSTPFVSLKSNSLSINPGILSVTNSLIVANLQQQPCRTVIKFSMRKGKRKSVKPVVKRFKRLDWGGWIRTLAGRHKHMWKKSAARKRRLRQHVFVNSQQATLLDKMVTKFWKRPRYYINDPYAPYHTREELRETRRKPTNTI
ncbi:large ribosomal subunit protein bL35m isoform X2 [Malaya genurostris]|uniref:large ribosomal subunit protein bL35m isoform X2 n=1 Tax=Malaya genurostris TaxID=325434 RepID=UPI0026F3E07D|nr:large ribosomal subunit protein bL35m isoform X2 [Malaya genurostris]